MKIETKKIRGFGNKFGKFNFKSFVYLKFLIDLFFMKLIQNLLISRRLVKTYQPKKKEEEDYQ